MKNLRSSTLGIAMEKRRWCVLSLRHDFHLSGAANVNNLWVTLLPCLFLPYRHVPITTFYLVFFWKLTNFNKFHKRLPLRNHKPDTVVRFFPQYTWTCIWNHKRRGVCIALHSPHTTSVGVPWGPLHKDAPLYLRIVYYLGGKIWAEMAHSLYFRCKVS